MPAPAARPPARPPAMLEPMPPPIGPAATDRTYPAHIAARAVGAGRATRHSAGGRDTARRNVVDERSSKTRRPPAQESPPCPRGNAARARRNVRQTAPCIVRSTETEFGLQRLDRARVFIRKAGLQLFGLTEFGACKGRLAFARVQLRLNVVRLGAVRMIAQDLIHHLLRLIEVAARGRLIDLVDRRFGSPPLPRSRKPRKSRPSRQGMQQKNFA